MRLACANLTSLPGLYLLTGLAGLLASGLALGQTRTGYVGVSQGFSHDTNVFRAPKGQQENSDSYLSTGLLAAVDLPISRQRLSFSGSARKNKFNELSRLDNVSYALTTRLDWSTAERLSGNLSYAANRNLASFSGETGPRLSTKNIETTRQVDAVARVGEVTPLSLEVSYQGREVAYSAPEFDSREFDQAAVKLRLLFRNSAKLSVGAGLRFTEGKFPLYRREAGGVYVPDSYKRRDLDVDLAWAPTGLSTVTGRVSISRQRNSVATQNEFSGVTGALTWAYRASAKTQLSTSISRDTGAENRFFDLGTGSTGTTDTSKLSTTMRLDARYDVTEKLRLNTGLAYTQRSLTELFSLTNAGAQGARSGTDKSTQASLTATYAPTRSLSFECRIAKESRNSDTTLSYDYAADVFGCTAQAQLTLR